MVPENLKIPPAGSWCHFAFGQEPDREARCEAQADEDDGQDPQRSERLERQAAGGRLCSKLTGESGRTLRADHGVQRPSDASSEREGPGHYHGLKRPMLIELERIT